MQIPCNRLDRLFAMHQAEYEEKAVEVLRSGYYIMGQETKSFEREFAAFLGGGYVAGVGCGLDAIRIALHVLGVGAGDEVVIQGNTFIAAVLAILQNGATPVFAEPDDGFGLSADSIEKALTQRTKAVIVTHLYGMVTPMAPIVSLCRERRLLLLEDAAQAHGAADGKKKAGTFGDAGCFSFYPTKNLGGFGDGGAVFVNDPALAEKIQIYKNYGSEKKYRYTVAGVNSRLDELQAGLLRVRLNHLDEINAGKAAAAEYYTAGITNPYVVKPVPAAGTT